MKVREIRRKLARAISESGGPNKMEQYRQGKVTPLDLARQKLANAVRDPEDNKDLADTAKMLVDSWTKRKTFCKDMSEKYPAIAKWTGPDVVQRFDGRGGPLVIEFGLAGMRDFGTEEQINAYFEKYVTSPDTAEATFHAFQQMFRRWTEWGYIKEFEDKEPEANYDEGDLPILADRSMGWVTENLVRANPSLDYETVKKDLIEVIFA
jgi:hypothetical protein